MIATPHHYLISIFRNNVHFVSVAQTEGFWTFLKLNLGLIIATLYNTSTWFFHLLFDIFKMLVLKYIQLYIFTNIFCFISVPPLFVIEFLHRVFETFVDYFSDCNEQIINDHIVVVFEVKKIYESPNGIQWIVYMSSRFTIVKSA